MGEGGDFGTGQFAGSGSAQQLVPANPMRKSLQVYASATGGYVGGPNVKTTNGMPVPATSSPSPPYETSTKDAVYCVGSVTFYWAETYYD